MSSSATTPTPYRIEWAAAMLAEAPPEKLRTHWSEVREVYTSSRNLHRSFARAHPIPFIEYTITNDDTESVRFGLPLILAGLHVEAVQTWWLNEASWWLKPRFHGGTALMIGMVLWLLGDNPNRRIKLVSSNVKEARKRLQKIGRFLEGKHPAARLMNEVSPTSPPTLPPSGPRA